MDSESDVTRRTWLAAERTWLAWWRTALGTTVAGIGVGGVLPNVTDATRWPFAVLGSGYAVLAVALFAIGARRWRMGEDALRRGGFNVLDARLVAALSAVGALLALVTLVVVLVEL